ncbi:hypothetical protein [Legionella fairfieldensis]|uniref:hypothetical protein n=1 Tax=Legionella fairfieldensis TaxID=45064 RepID=UPI0004905C5D|nr:hypothetical protein [Legionella fairfieldensis]
MLPNIQDVIKNDITELYRDYKTQKEVFPPALKKALNEYHSKSTASIIAVYQASASSLSRLSDFRPGIRPFIESCLTKSMIKLCNRNLLTQVNFNLIVENRLSALDLENLVSALNRAEELQLLSVEHMQAYFKLLAGKKLAFDTFDKPSNEKLFNSEQGQFYFNEIIKHDTPDELIDALSRAFELGLIKNVQSSQCMIVHPDPNSLSNVLNRLPPDIFLDEQYAQANFLAIVRNKQIRELAVVLQDLIQIDKITFLSGQNAQSNFEALLACPELQAFSEALSHQTISLVLDGEESQANFLALTRIPKPISRVKILGYAYQAGLIGFLRNGGQTLIGHKMHSLILNDMKLDEVSEAMSYLQDAGLLQEQGPANFAKLLMHQNPRDLAQVLSKLLKVDLLTQVNFLALISHENLEGLSRVFESFYDLILRTREKEQKQSCFEEIITYQNNLAPVNWCDIPPGYMTMAHFNTLIDLCIQYRFACEQGQAVIQDYVSNEILKEEQQQTINPVLIDEHATVNSGPGLFSRLIGFFKPPSKRQKRQAEQFTGGPEW